MSQAYPNLTDLSPAAKRALLRQMLQQKNALPAAAPALIHEHIARQAAQTPTAVALVAGDQMVTYQALNSQANQLAHHLQGLGVSQGSAAAPLVAVALEPSVDLVVTLLAVLKAGGAFVALDPTDAVEQMRIILDDDALQVLVTTESFAEGRLTPLLAARRPPTVLCLACDRQTINSQPTTAPETTATPSTVAYVSYTRAGGLALTHGAVVERLQWLRNHFGFTAADTFLQQAAVSHDAAIAELFSPLFAGGCLRLSPPITADPLPTRPITVAFLTAARLAAQLAQPDAVLSLAALRLALCYGEPVPPPLVEQFAGLSRAQLHELYLLPELGGEAYTQQITATAGAITGVITLPPHRSLYLLDEALEPTPLEVKGELYIGGKGLPAAYRPAVDNAAQRLIANPFAGNGAEPLWPSGEFGRRRNNGLVERLGTRPGQAWIDGYRVELATVEAALAQQPGIEEVAVLPRVTTMGVTTLVAYLVVPTLVAGAKSDYHQWATQLQAALRAWLPAHWLPIAYVPLAGLPLTVTGTIDVAALAKVPVLTPALLAQWEATLAAQPEVQAAAVVVREKVQAQPRLHLADLFADWQNLTTRLTTAPPTKSAIDEAADGAITTPALVEGAPLLHSATDPTTLCAVLLNTVAHSPTQEIIYLHPDGLPDLYSEARQSYAQLLDEATRLLGGLRTLGLQPGDRVLFQFDANHDFVTAFWACLLGGFVPAPLAPATRYEEGDSGVVRLANAWRLLGAPLILTGERLAPAITALSTPARPWRVAALNTLRHAPPAHDWHTPRPDDLAVLFLTSGSTGAPKAVMQSHASLIGWLLGTRQQGFFTAQDISLNWMPLDHVGGLIYFHLRDLFLGCRQLHAPTPVVLQNPLHWLDWIDQHRVTVTWAPNFAYALVNADGPAVPENGGRTWDLTCLRYTLNGGEAVVPKTARRFLELLAPFGLAPTVMHPSWGMSETCSGVIYSQRFRQTTTSDDDLFAEVGEPIPGFALRIVDEQDQLLTEEVVGRLQVRGPSVTQGYWQNPAQNAEAFTADGWFNTGDRGVVRAGQLTLTGRDKDTIIINGVNYHSHDLEALVEEVAGVEVSYTAAVAVRPTGSETDQLAIFFKPSDDDEATLLGLLHQIRQQLLTKLGLNPSYLVPVAAPEVPKTAIGKIQRAQLRQQFLNGAFAERLKALDLLSGNDNTLPNWFYQKVWRPKQITTRASLRRATGYLLFVDHLGLGAALGAALAEQQHPCIYVACGDTFAQHDAAHFQIRPDQPEDYDRLLAAVAATGVTIEQALHLWSYTAYNGEINNGTALQGAQAQGSSSLLLLAQAWQRQPSPAQLRLTVVSSHLQAVHPADPLAYEKAPLLGLLKTMAQEMSWLQYSHVDLPPATDAVNVALLLQEIQSAQPEREVAYRQDERLVPRLTPVPLTHNRQPLPFQPGGVYIISGGLGGIGVEIARYLLNQYGARLLLLGRTVLPEPNVALTLPVDDPRRQRVERYAQLAQLGGAVRYAAVDISDAVHLQAVVTAALAPWGGQINGVIHLAGHFQEQWLMEETLVTLASVLAPKMAGTWALHQLVKDAPGALFIHFSSVNGFFGGATVGAYAAANSFVDAFAAFQQRHTAVQSYSLAWSMWDEIGMSRAYGLKALTAARGYHLINAAQGLHAFLAALQQPAGQCWIGIDGGNPHMRRHLEPIAPHLQEPVAYLVSSAPTLPVSTLPLFDQFQTPSNCQFFPLPHLPRTATGAVDRAQLQELAAANHVPAVRQGAPRTATEQQLATIWQALLGRPQVGIHDNFFALGGDSILTIQAVARAQQAGLHFTPKDLFQYQTIAELAPVVQVATVVKVAEQGLLTGLVPLTPIQHWFFAQALTAPHHFNMALLLATPPQLDPDHLRAVVQALLRHHDALRLRFTRTVTGWQQAYAPPDDDHLPFQVIDLRALPPSAQTAQIEAHAATAQTTLDLAQGPLLRALWFDCGAAPGRLLLVLHHLVVDGVSWRILVEDLLLAYQQAARGATIHLPPKTTAWQHWSQRLTAYAQHTDVQAALAGWLDLPWQQVTPLPLDRPGATTTNQVAATATVTVTLDGDYTRALLQTAPVAYHAAITDLLLAALAQSIAQWTGQSTLLVDVEGHGRADLFADVDTARTVGWFTTLAPVLLDVAPTQPLNKQLQAIKEQVRRLPPALTYGLLRYLAQETDGYARLAALPPAQISFNYLGQFDQTFADADAWRPVEVALGYDRCPTDPRLYLFDVVGLVADGELQLTWSYSRDRHEPATVTLLAETMKAALLELVDGCDATTSAVYVPSDFPLAAIEQATLDRLAQQGRIEDIYPLSPMQQGMLFHTLYSTEATGPQAYLEQIHLTLRGALQIAAFQQAWQQVMAANPILRTAFIWGDAQPLQVVYQTVALPLMVADWRALLPAEQATALTTLLQNVAHSGVDLAQPGLFRLALLQTAADCYEFVFSHHHALLDGWSLPLLFADLFAAYAAASQGQTLTLTPRSPYRNYIHWLQQQDAAQATAFWDSYLQGFDTPTTLRLSPPVAAEPAQPTAAYGQYEFALSPETSTALQRLAHQQRLTLNTLVQGAWALLLSRYSGEEDVIFGSVVAGRPPTLPGVESIIGLFINTLPVRVRTPGAAPLLPWLQALQQEQVARDQYAHCALPEIQKSSAVATGTPLFATIVAFENYPLREGLQEGDLTVEQAAFSEYSHYPLTLVAMPAGATTLGLRLHYATADYTPAAIERLAGHLQTLLAAMAADPQQTLDALPLTTVAETAQLLSCSNGAVTAYPAEATVQQLFEEQVAQTPDAVALVFGATQLSYAELNRRANRLAHHLLTLPGAPIGPETRVGLFVERSLEMVVAMLAILKAGGVYVPLEPLYGAERLAFMLADANVALLLTQRALVDKAPPTTMPVIVLDEPAAWCDASCANPPLRSDADHLAYVMYTSGSTGRPKGVSIPHRGIVRLVKVTNYVTFAPDDGFLQLAPIAFDAATFEIWGPLLNGGRLAIMPPGTPTLEALADALRDYGVTTLWLTAGLFTLMVDEQLAALTGLRQLLAGGDVLPLPQVRRLLAAGGECRLINGYGPTENTTFTCCFPVTADTDLRTSVPIGGNPWPAIANSQVYILDHHRQLTPVGVAGELYIGGAGLARDYLGRPDLTAEKFVPHPFDRTGGARLYRTGDLVRYRPTTGEAPPLLEFIGRLDNQVKIRGFRIELGEVAATLAQHPAVRETVVVVRQEQEAGGRSHKRLVAYVAPQAGQTPTTAELQHFLQSRLPEYMVPGAFVMLDALPLTPNGKIDRRALPAPGSLPLPPAGAYAAPQAAIEARLAHIWATVLGAPQVGIDQNFFELGGDSILSIQIVSRARAAGIQLTPKLIFEHQTIAALAAVAGTTVTVMAEQGPVTGSAPLTPIQHWFFAQRLPAPHHFNQAVFLEVAPDLQVEALTAAINQLLHHHDALRMCFPAAGATAEQVNLAPEAWLARHTTPLRIIDLTHLVAHEQRAALEAAAAALQTTLDLTTGRLFQAALFHLGADQPARLLLVIHHLVVDAVSWRILLEDLALAYEQQRRGDPIYLPPKTTSFTAWATRLTAYAQTPAARAEVAYWSTLADAAFAPLPLDGVDGPTANRKADADQVTVTLSPVATAGLLHQAPAMHRSQINALLLTALAQSLVPWTGTHSLLVDLEGHGRVDLFDDMDLSRTVGWFTTIQPVLLTLPMAADEPGAAVRAIQNTLQQAPLGGIGYGLLRYLPADEQIRGALAALPQAQISFNYLGQLDQVGEGEHWRSAAESSGPAHSPAGVRPYWLEVSAFVVEGQLQVDWVYSPHLHQRTTIAELADRFISALQRLIDHSQPHTQAYYTPADFALAGLDDQGLHTVADLLADIDE